MCKSCQERRLLCTFDFPAAQPAKHSTPAGSLLVGDDQRSESISPRQDQHNSDQRRQQLLIGTPGRLELRAETRHTMHFIIRVLKSWPRMMAAPDLSLVPPMIHNVQFEHGTPTPLANCFTLAKMWIERIEGSSRLVHTSIIREIQSLFHEV